MSEDIEQSLHTVAVKALDEVRGDGITDRSYEQVMSSALTEREINHETHKKIYDERKGKYRFIDLYFPDHKTFAKLRAKKYITRTDVGELKEDEAVVGCKGIIVNFFDGLVTFKHSGSARSRNSNNIPPLSSQSEPIHHMKHVRKRKQLPQISASTGKLNDLNERNFKPQLYRYHKYPPTPSLTDVSTSSNTIFALSCAAFFLSNGDRSEFSSIFNDLLQNAKLEKIDIPAVFLDGPKMKTPDPDVADILQNALSGKFRQLNLRGKDDPDFSNPGSKSRNSINSLGSPEREHRYASSNE